MALKDDLAADLSIFFDTDDFADEGEYTSRDAGETVSVSAIMDYGQAPGEDKASTNSTQATAHVILSQLPAPPRNGDLLTVDGVAWSVIRRSGGDSLVATLELRRDARNRFTK